VSKSGGKVSQIAVRSVKLQSVAFLALALTLALHSPALRADADVDSVCAGALDNTQASAPSPDAPGAGPNQQKLQYCQAAKSAKEGANSDRALYKVWGAVGVVCTYACTASFVGGPTSEHACTGATMGGSVTQATVTKDFNGALTSIASAGGGYAMNAAANGQNAKSGGEAAEKGAEKGKDAAGKPKKKDFAACMNAATAVGTSITKFKGMQSNERAAETNLNSAMSVQAATAGEVKPFKPGADSGSSDANSGASGGGNGSDTFAQQGANGQSSGNACAPGGSGASVIQCAIQSDRNVPAFVTSPRFAQDFQKKTGQSLNNFLTSPDSASPTRPLADAMSGAVPSGQAGKLATALETLNQGLDTEGMGGTYVGGGGNSDSGGGGGDEMAQQMGAMMQGLMDQMNPDKAKEAQKSGVFAVDFAYRANQGRNLAAVADDKKLSIFDRVTYRYYFVGKRIVQGESKR
jgi:hypothetical protein